MADSSQAWVFSERGLPGAVLSLTSRPTPTLPPPLPLPRDVPEPEEWLLVRTSFAGLNPGAIFQMTLVPPFARQPMCVPEMDFSGTVVDVWHPDGDGAGAGAGAGAGDGTGDGDGDGDGARGRPRFKKGDKVVAMLPASHTLPTGTGALAEYIRLPARYAVAKPAGVSFGDAAGVLLPGLTARQMVAEAGVKPGDRVLVHAASGGIGTLVVQMVRRAVGDAGYVVGVCSGKNAELVLSLGADEVVDYTQHDPLSTHLTARFSSSPFDAIIDTFGLQPLYLASPSYLTPTGLYTSVGIKAPTFFFGDFLRAVVQMKLNEWWPVSRWLGGVGRRWCGVSMMSPSLEDRQSVIDMLAAGHIRLVRDSVWSFDQVKEAYAKLGGLHARGKVLVKVDAAVGDDEC